jgi:adenylylsulfate reductase, subunit A
MPKFETVVVETDLLILGGGMAACGAAVEAASWAKQNGLKVTLVDKAAVDRSGAVAMGLSAINQYVGPPGRKYARSEGRISATPGPFRNSH